MIYLHCIYLDHLDKVVFVRFSPLLSSDTKEGTEEVSTWVISSITSQKSLLTVANMSNRLQPNRKYSALFPAVKQKSSNMENNKWDHSVNREYMVVCVQLRGTLNIRGRCVDLILHAKWLQSWQTLCRPMECSPPGSSVHGILQGRILAWVAISFSRRSSQPKGRTCISYVSSTGRKVCFHWQHLWSFIFYGW